MSVGIAVKDASIAVKLTVREKVDINIECDFILGNMIEYMVPEFSSAPISDTIALIKPASGSE